MFAELIVDLSDLGGSISKASGQSVTALPKLTSLARLWRQLGIEVSAMHIVCLLYTSPSPRDATLSRMPSSA